MWIRKVGDVIEHPVTRERMKFLVTGAETGGELLRIEMTVGRGGFVTSPHIHPTQSERFVVQAGALRLRIDGEERLLGAGDEATVAPGTPHVWWNAGEDELSVLLEFRPAGRFDAFISTWFALGKLGRTNARGMPGLLQAVVTTRAYLDVLRPVSPPPVVLNAVLAVLEPIARLRGLRPDVEYPLGPSEGAGDSATTDPTLAAAR
jgi:quercetin dioxygenase-like cupin family protein